MPNQDLTPLLRDRWSPRVLDPLHELSDDELRLLLEAARWAPSGGNMQRWGFLVGLRGDATFKEVCSHLTPGNASWVPAASAVIVTAFQSATAPGAEKEAWLEWAEYDLGQTAAHLTVQAASMGLVVHQFSGFDHDGIADAFAVPEHFTVATGIAIGRLGDPEGSDVQEKPRSVRRPLGEIAFAGTWGEEALR